MDTSGNAARSDLIGATASLTGRFVKYVAAIDPATIAKSPFRNWVEQGKTGAPVGAIMPSRHYSLADRPHPDPQLVANTHRGEIQAWPETIAVLEIIKRAFDRWLQKGQPSQMAVDPYLAAVWVPVWCAERRTGDSWTDEDFKRAFDQFFDSLSATKCVVELICPLAGFVSPTNVQLRPGLEIRLLDDETIKRLLDFGLGDLDSFRMTPATARWRHAHAIFSQYESSDESLRNPMENSEIWTLLAKLHSFKRGAVAVVGGMASWKSVFSTARHGWHGAAKGQGWLVSYQLSAEEIPLFERFSADVDRHLTDASTKQGERRRLELCLSRLSASSSRETAADRLLDCCNVAELMFSDGPGSIAYRVAQKVAVAAHALGWEGLTVLNLVTEAYAHRNKLAHGGGEDPSEDSVAAFEAVLRAILRSSIHQERAPIQHLRKVVDESIVARLFPKA